MVREGEREIEEENGPHCENWCWFHVKPCYICIELQSTEGR